jgi:hypothetical protein
MKPLRYSGNNNNNYSVAYPDSRTLVLDKELISLSR